MKSDNAHITGYLTYAISLIILLFLTAATIMAASLNLKAFAAAAALIIAGIKAGTVINYFMHLRSEGKFLKRMVVGVFLLYSLIIIITFIDYLFR